MAARVDNGYLCNFVSETNTLNISHHRIDHCTMSMRRSFTQGVDRLDQALPEGVESLEETAKKVTAILTNPEFAVANLVITYVPHRFMAASYDVNLDDRADISGALLQSLLENGNFTSVKFYSSTLLGDLVPVTRGGKAKKILEIKAENNRAMESCLFSKLMAMLNLQDQ